MNVCLCWAKERVLEIYYECYLIALSTNNKQNNKQHQMIHSPALFEAYKIVSFRIKTWQTVDNQQPFFSFFWVPSYHIIRILVLLLLLVNIGLFAESITISLHKKDKQMNNNNNNNNNNNAAWHDLAVVWVRSGEVEKMNLKALVAAMKPSFPTHTAFLRAGGSIKDVLCKGLNDEELRVYYEPMPRKVRGVEDNFKELRLVHSRISSKLSLYFKNLEEYMFPAKDPTPLRLLERQAYLYNMQVPGVPDPVTGMFYFALLFWDVI